MQSASLLSQHDWPGAAVLWTLPAVCKAVFKMWLPCVLTLSFLISPTINKKPALPQSLHGSRGVEGQQFLLRDRVCFL